MCPPASPLWGWLHAYFPSHLHLTFAHFFCTLPTCPFNSFVPLSPASPSSSEFIPHLLIKEGCRVMGDCLFSFTLAWYLGWAGCGSGVAVQAVPGFPSFQPCSGSGLSPRQDRVKNFQRSEDRSFLGGARAGAHDAVKQLLWKGWTCFILLLLIVAGSQLGSLKSPLMSAFQIPYTIINGLVCVPITAKYVQVTYLHSFLI